jgi:hypothetical protein
MRKILLLSLSLILTTVLTGQRSVWDGGMDGTGTDWGTAANWVGDVLPSSGDSILFNTIASVTGTAVPVRNVYVNGGTVTLSLDLTVGDGVAVSNGLQLSASSSLTVTGGVTLTLNPEASKNGLQIGATANDAAVIIQSGGTVNINGGKHGINISGIGSSIMAMGTMTIDGVVTNGIRLTDGTFENRGGLNISNAGVNAIENDATFTNVQTSTTVLTITDAGTTGIKNKAGGVFTNDKDIVITGGGITNDGINTEGSFINVDNSAIITTSGMDDDGIEVAGGTFDNGGTVTTTAKTGASTGNNALAITAGTFTNTSDNSLNADGGDVGRAIGISAGGSLLNSGTVTLTGGDDGNRINSAGDVTNSIGGTIDVTDGRINTSGTLTNDGIIISTRGAAGIFNTGTATNNAFYTYGGGNFTSGSGTLTDDGISLDKIASWRIDVMNGCSVKIANVPYEYTDAGASVGTSAADGTFTFDATTFSTTDVNIKPVGLTFPTGLKVRLQNATCNPALPVELTALEAVAMPKSIMVKWTVATETDNNYIAVERSTDAATFTEIGRIAGNGTQALSTDYELEDKYPVSGTNYYRLRQVDEDGTTNYSHVVSADFAGANAGAMKVFPTVVSAGGQLNVDLRETSATSLFLTDAHGRRVGTYQLEGGGVASLSIGSLQRGMYYLRSSGSTATTRFIVK